MSVLVGKTAPDFSATAVVNGSEFQNDFTLSQFRGKYVVLYFYPVDFSFVCPTEILAFQDRLAEFEERDAQVIGVSVDSKYTHRAWLSTPRSEGGIQGVTHPLVSDWSKTISANYGVLGGEYEYTEDGNGDLVLGFTGVAQAYRGLFIIDRKGVVRSMVVNDFALGRSIDETLRMLGAIRHNDESGLGCPVNWTEGGAAKP
jgi:peroxiredoxin (alkyl hydroperoxide reductase subunit C)